MTLYRQLIAGISILFLVLLVGIEASYLANARAQIAGQLGAQAQDAATAIAMRLAPLASLDDPALVEATVNPVFDRGWFQEIRVLNVDGGTVVRKALPPAEAGVPAWFSALLPIAPPAAESLVSAGWRQLGRVLVVSQPHFAQVQLWRAGTQTLGWLVAGYLAALAAAAVFLAMLLRPLRAIERAAVAIGERDLVHIGFTPKARELARVVRAFNEMSGRIREVIAEAAARAEAYRREAFVDPVTGLYNRRGFDRQLQALAQSTGDVHDGALVLVEIGRFGEFNARVGYKRGDEVLALLAGAIAAAGEGHLTVCARLGGVGFALAALNVNREGLALRVRAVCGRVGDVLAGQGLERELHFHCGATHAEGAFPELPALLAAADLAVAQARVQGENASAIVPFGPAPALGSQAWRALIVSCLDEDRIALYAQGVVGSDATTPVHSEVMARLERPGEEPLAASQFLPMAVRHGLAGRLDCRVLERLLAHMVAEGGEAQYALNLAAWTVADPSWSRRLLALLEGRGVPARRLVFEMTEFGALRDLALTQRFSAELRRRGAGFAVDNFGMRQDTLKLIHALRPQYIKLAGAYSQEIATSQDCRFLVSSLVHVTRPLGIAIYAQAVEDAGLVGRLAELGIAGFQGFAIAKPARLP